MRIKIYMHTNHKHVTIKQTSMATGDVHTHTECMCPGVYANRWGEGYGPLVPPGSAPVVVVIGV